MQCGNGNVFSQEVYIFSYLNNETNIEFIHDINGLVQDCSNSIVDALELLQSCIKTSMSVGIISP